jgi:hypothetical protein
MNYSFLHFFLSAKSEQAKRKKNIQSPRDDTARPSAASRHPGELILEKILGSFIPDSGNQQRSAAQQSVKKTPDTSEVKPALTAKSQSDKYVLRQKMGQLRKQKLLLQKQSLEPKFNERTPVEPEIQKLPEFTTDAVKNIETSYQKVTTGVPASQYLPDFSDSDSLRRAILYYEVLGRPLSLRDSSDPFMGL